MSLGPRSSIDRILEQINVAYSFLRASDIAFEREESASALRHARQAWRVAVVLLDHLPAGDAEKLNALVVELGSAIRLRSQPD